MKHVLPLLQLLLVVALQNQGLFVEAKQKRVVRGSQKGKRPFEIPDSSLPHSTRMLKPKDSQLEKDNGGKDNAKKDNGGNDKDIKEKVTTREGRQMQAQKNNNRNKNTDPPTQQPTYSPTMSPTARKGGGGGNKNNKNTELPTYSPTYPPTYAPTDPPTSPPTDPPKPPVLNPTYSPTNQPTGYPTSRPTKPPTANPTNVPTNKPTNKPTKPPTSPPVLDPTNVPTNKPTNKPPNPPNDRPTNRPTVPPTWPPVVDPTNVPTDPPTNSPTRRPTDPPKALVPTQTVAPTVGKIALDELDQSALIEFDTTKFVAAERLEPVTFNITVGKFTPLMNKQTLEIYFKELFEGVLAMRSNRDWYPSHIKSIEDITLEFFPILSSGTSQLERTSAQLLPVQLVINGNVFVHANSQNKQQKDQVSFQDSFDHSMLLFFTFWGVDGVESALEEDGGLDNPVINSVGVGEKKLIGIDQDGNSLVYDGDSDVMESRFVEVDEKKNESGARASQHGLLALITISASIMWSVLC